MRSGTDEGTRRLRGRNAAVLLILLVLAGITYAVTVVKLGSLGVPG